MAISAGADKGKEAVGGRRVVGDERVGGARLRRRHPQDVVVVVGN